MDDDVRWDHAGEAVLDALAAELAAATSRQYRISPDEAKSRILAIWRPLRALQDVIREDCSPAKVKRTRAYRDGAVAAKKAIYYELRRYRRSDPAHAATIAEMASQAVAARPERMNDLVALVVSQHASTAERLPHLRAFLDQLVGALGSASSILDVGCGVFPLLFPFARLPALGRYCACDRDAASVRALAAYARWRRDGVLQPIAWQMASGWRPILDACGLGAFDVALMLKLVPLLQRQSPQLLEQLAQVPARFAVITGSREAMAKRNAIGHRELRAIDAFVDRHRFSRVSVIETPDELGYCVALKRG